MHQIGTALQLMRLAVLAGDAAASQGDNASEVTMQVLQLLQLPVLAGNAAAR